MGTENNKIDFTKEEKTTIAKFIYSQEKSVNVIPELFNILSNHNLIEGKELWLKKIEDKSLILIEDLCQVLKAKIPKEQGSEIMDEYYATIHGKEVVKYYEDVKWGVGDKGASKAFDTVKIGNEDYELIFGEHPHSRQDNTIYARSKKYPEEIIGFDGHRLPFKIEIEESNYTKRSGLSGNQIRKACSGKLFLNGIQIFECGGRTYDRAFKQIDTFIDSMEQMWSWYPNKLEEYQGNIVKYEGQLFKIERFIVSQACMILVTPDGKPRKPFQSEAEDLENNDFDGMESVKVSINSESIWWFPTKKEIESVTVPNS
jgi:hypothetical protein